MNSCHLKYVEHVWKYYLNLVKEKLVGSILEFTYLWDEALDRSAMYWGVTWINIYLLDYICKDLLLFQIGNLVL